MAAAAVMHVSVLVVGSILTEQMIILNPLRVILDEILSLFALLKLCK